MFRESISNGFQCCCEYVYAGTIKQTFREIPTHTHEMGCEHSVRRRGPIHRARILTLSNTYIHVIKYVFSFHCTRISTLSITCFHITEYVFLHHQIHISISPNTHFRSPFRGYIHICGHDKSAPTAADGLPFRCKRIAITWRTHTKCPTNIP